MSRRAILAVVAWVGLTCAGAAQTLTFPALTGRVVDQAGLLSAEDRSALTVALASLEAKTTDQLVIVTLKSLQGTSIEDYGYQLGRRWQIGQKDKNNGALLIVAASERRVRIEVGYGLEGTLTDALTRYIIETSILPRFKVGDFPGGIKLGTEQIIKVLTGDPDDLKSTAAQYTSDARRPNAETAVWPFLVLIVIGVGFLIFCTVTSGGAFCQVIFQILFFAMLSGSSRSSRGSSPFSGGGGSFGGGGSSGSW
jgi:uncharacterized protein